MSLKSSSLRNSTLSPVRNVPTNESDSTFDLNIANLPSLTLGNSNNSLSSISLGSLDSSGLGQKNIQTPKVRKDQTLTSVANSVYNPSLADNTRTSKTIPFAQSPKNTPAPNIQSMPISENVEKGSLTPIGTLTDIKKGTLTPLKKTPEPIEEKLLSLPNVNNYDANNIALTSGNAIGSSNKMTAKSEQMGKTPRMQLPVIGQLNKSIFSGIQTPSTNFSMLNTKTPQNMSPINEPISFSTLQEKLVENVQEQEECNNDVCQPTSEQVTTISCPDSQSEEKEFLSLLKEKGYKISNVLIDNGKLKNVIATNIRGDIVLIEVDEEIKKTQNYEEKDLLMQKNNDLLVVPQKTKVGTLACLDPNLCRAAFVCNDSICLVKKQELNGKGTTFSEENAIIQLSSQNLGGKKGNGSIAYPSLLSSTIINPKNDELDISSMISKSSENLMNFAVTDLSKNLEDYRDTLKSFKRKIKSVEIIFSKLEEYNEDIRILEENYEKLLTSEDSEEVRKLRNVYQNNLIKKKSIRIRLINSLYIILNTSGLIDTIGKDIDEVVNPVLNEFMSSIHNVEL